MDRKTKHRILGIFVVIGLIVILFPFFQSKKGVAPETMIVKAPPFPDQSVQVNAPSETIPPTAQAAPSVDNDVPDDLTDETETLDQTDQSPPLSQSDNKLVPQVQNNRNQQPDDTINPNRSTDLNNTDIPATVVPVAPATPATAPVPAAPSLNKSKPNSSTKTTSSNPVNDMVADAENIAPKNLTDVVATDEDTVQASKVSATEEKIVTKVKSNKTKLTKTAAKKVSVKKAVHVAQKQVKPKALTKTQTTALMKAPLDKNGLFNLKSPVWVVQLGSFKNKANALRLVNQLRASGYRAFIQEFNTAFGNSTRVFVGPENKPTSARDLANKLESNMHLHGIIISYKPLAL